MKKAEEIINWLERNLQELEVKHELNIEEIELLISYARKKYCGGKT